MNEHNVELGHSTGYEQWSNTSIRPSQNRELGGNLTVNGCLMNGSYQRRDVDGDGMPFRQIGGSVSKKHRGNNTNYAQRPRIVLRIVLQTATTTCDYDTNSLTLVILKDHRCFFLTLCCSTAGGFRLM